MARKSIFTDFQVKEIKEIIRTGEPVMMLAEKLAAKYNVPESSMRNKLYNIARRTYKIAEWQGPKRRKLKYAQSQQVETVVESPVRGGVPKKVTIEEDHIRIYF